MKDLDVTSSINGPHYQELGRMERSSEATFGQIIIIITYMHQASTSSVACNLTDSLSFYNSSRDRLAPALGSAMPSALLA